MTISDVINQIRDDPCAMGIFFARANGLVAGYTNVMTRGFDIVYYTSSKEECWRRRRRRNREQREKREEKKPKTKSRQERRGSDDVCTHHPFLYLDFSLNTYIVQDENTGRGRKSPSLSLFISPSLSFLSHPLSYSYSSSSSSSLSLFISFSPLILFSSYQSEPYGDPECALLGL